MAPEQQAGSACVYVNLLVNNLKAPVYFLIKGKDINCLGVHNVTYSCHRADAWSFKMDI